MCVCSDYWGLSNGASSVGLDRNYRQMVWNEFITSHPRKLLLSGTKKQLFSLGVVILNSCRHLCSTQLPDQVLPSLLQESMAAQKLVRGAR